jgi:hypothetical protein
MDIAAVCGGDTNVPRHEILSRRVHEILETGQEFPANSGTRAQVEAVAGKTPITRPLLQP